MDTSDNILSYLFGWLAMTASAGLLALLFAWLVPVRIGDAVYRTARAEPGKSIGIGILCALALPSIAIVAILSLIGIPLGILLFPSLGLVAFAGFVAGGWVLGRYIAERTNKTWSRLATLLIGVGILCAAALIPALGTIVWIAASAFGVGASALAMWNARDERRRLEHRPPPPPAPQEPIRPPAAEHPAGA